MEVETFTSCLKLINTYSAMEMQESKMSLNELISDLEERKIEVSNEMRRIAYFCSVENIPKKETIQVIDDVFLPKQIRYITPKTMSVLSDIKLKAIERIKNFHKTKERISKDFESQQLRVRQLAKTLSNIYRESDEMKERQLVMASCDKVRIFLEQEGVSALSILANEDEVKRNFYLFNERFGGVNV